MMSLRGVLQHVHSGEGTASAVLREMLLSAESAIRNRKCFSELCPLPSDVQSALPLAGAVAAVSDSIDIRGCTTTYGLSAKMLHRIADADHPLLQNFREKGVQFIGHLTHESPMGFLDGASFTSSCAADAIHMRCCHVAVLSSVVGAAALPSAKHGVFGFKPTKGVFPFFSPQDPAAAPLSTFRPTISLACRDISDMVAFWTAFTSGAAVPSAADEQSHSCTSFAATSALKIGVPFSWIDAVKKGTSEVLKKLIMGSASSGGTVQFYPFDVPWSADSALTTALTLAQVELVAALKDTLDSPGILQEMPQLLVSNSFEGKQLTRQQCDDALGKVVGIREHVAQVLSDCDAIAVPLLCEGHPSGNIRSAVFSLPFVLSGNPMCTLSFDQDASSALPLIHLQMIGEMGRDSGLLSDAASWEAAVRRHREKLFSTPQKSSPQFKVVK